MNQERFTVRDHSSARTPSYYQRYRDMGFRHVRFFIPYGVDWSGVNGAGDINPWLEAVRACVDSGMPVTHLDLSDVMWPYQMGQSFDDYIAAACDKIAPMNLPKDRFIIGAINEYGGYDNPQWKPHRFRTNQIIRNKLPGHTIVEGPGYWKNIQCLFDPGFRNNDLPNGPGVYEPWPDPNTIQDVHHYYDWAFADMDWLARECLNWGQRNGRAVFSGEWGFGHLTNDRYGHMIQLWVDRFEQQSTQLSIAKIRPTLWAVTDGNDWRMNEYGSNTIRPEMAPYMHEALGVPDRQAGRASLIARKRPGGSLPGPFARLGRIRSGSLRGARNRSTGQSARSRQPRRLARPPG